VKCTAKDSAHAVALIVNATQWFTSTEAKALDKIELLAELWLFILYYLLPQTLRVTWSQVALFDCWYYQLSKTITPSVGGDGMAAWAVHLAREKIK